MNERKKNGSLRLLRKKRKDTATRRAIKNQTVRSVLLGSYFFPQSRKQPSTQSWIILERRHAIVRNNNANLELVMLQTNNYAINTRVKLKKKKRTIAASYFVIIRQRAIPCYLKVQKSPTYNTKKYNTNSDTKCSVSLHHTHKVINILYI